MPVKMKVLFLGFALPDGEFEAAMRSDRGLHVQTQRFGWSIISALRSVGATVQVISAAPIADFPHNTKLIFRGNSFEAQTASGVSISFVNITGLKHVTRYVTSGIAAGRLAPEIPDVVLVHGLHSAFIWRALRLARVWDVPAVVVMTDPPSLRTPYDNLLSRGFKRLDRGLILGGLQRSDGVIALTHQLADDFAPGIPMIVMEGIARPLPEVQEKIFPSWYREDLPAVIYAGSLREDYGVSLLADALARSSGSWQLVVYGKGPLESTFESLAEADPRMTFGGMASAGELAQAYNAAAALINPRPPDARFTGYSFPSKLLEYLAAGRPVFTTRLSGIPGDYDEVVEWIEPTALQIASKLDQFFERPSGLRECCGRGRDFALGARGTFAQGKRMLKFLSDRVSASKLGGIGY